MLFALAAAHLLMLVFVEWWVDVLEDVIGWINDGVSSVFEQIPIIENVWDSGNGDIALSSGQTLAVLGPIVLALAIQRILRFWLFRDL